MATKHIATWANKLKYSDLPQDVIQSASRSLHNWVGCAIGGSDHPATAIAYNSLSPFFGPPQSSLLGRKGVKIDAQHAALINGIASHVHDYDDTHLDTIVHPTGPVASALLAVAEWKGGFSGKEFLPALIVGIEAECKLGLAVWPEHYDVGWLLLGSSVEQTSHALGVAATQVIGLREMFGSHTKSFHPGRAAQSGLIAAVLAQGGYTSSETAIEAKRGWANVVGATKSSIAESLEKWLGMDNQGLGLASINGGRWQILRNSFKPYPCGIVIHPVIDGCSQLHRDIAELGLEVADIKEVKAKVHPLVLELTGKRKPKDGLEGKFSVFHGGTIGLIFGKGTPGQYETEVVRDPAVLKMRDKIECEADATIATDETKIVLTMVDGKVLEKHVKHAVGSIEVPMDDQMLRQKFEDQCAAVLGGETGSASTKCWNVGDVSDIAEIARLA
ncbi:mmge/prpd family protein-like protein [Hyaloscypha finlandica]|nr:mmge/prpd family protein-like protein [Hyaloscypha finlandica]